MHLRKVPLVRACLKSQKRQNFGWTPPEHNLEPSFLISDISSSIAYIIIRKTEKVASFAILTKFMTSMIIDTHVSDVPCNLAFISPSPYLFLPWANLHSNGLQSPLTNFSLPNFDGRPNFHTVNFMPSSFINLWFYRV